MVSTVVNSVTDIVEATTSAITWLVGVTEDVMLDGQGRSVKKVMLAILIKKAQTILKGHVKYIHNLG